MTRVCLMGLVKSWRTLELVRPNDALQPPPRRAAPRLPAGPACGRSAASAGWGSLLNSSTNFEGANAAEELRCDYPKCTQKNYESDLHERIRREEYQQPKPSGRGFARIETDPEVHNQSVKASPQNDAKQIPDACLHGPFSRVE